MPSCNATVKRDSPCVSRFATETGRVFYIGSPGADEDVGLFLGTLEDGKSYYLPEAFMQYLKAKKAESNTTSETTSQ